MIEVFAKGMLKQNDYRLLVNDCYLLKVRNSNIATSLNDREHMLFIKQKIKSKVKSISHNGVSNIILVSSLSVSTHLALFLQCLHR